VRVCPITASIAAEVARLPEPFHKDPADRLIVATSRVLGAPLVTLDDRILKSGLVSLWATPSKPRTLTLRHRLPRLFDLMESVDDRENPNSYFQNFEASLGLPTGKLDAMMKLESQLARLDAAAWADLKPRAARCAVAATPRQDGRGWQDMFDVFTEARAYGYLRAIGASDIRLVPRSDRAKRPDLEAISAESKILCEVKSINVSDVQAEKNRRRSRGEVTIADARTEVEGGLLEKVTRTIAAAIGQLRSFDESHQSRWVVFVGLNFDDFLNEFIDRYLKQIDDYLTDHPVTEVELVFAPRANPFERRLTMRNAAVYLE
jgi:hypothetical protein